VVEGMAATTDPSWALRHMVDLDDGTATLRPIAPSDDEALGRFHHQLSARSVQQRYFYPHADLRPDELEHLTRVNGVDRVALVVERAGELIAVGRYERLDDPDVAEVAFVVADDFQHHGIATMLLHHLVVAARSAGITRFIAEVLAENKAMLSVFQDAGFPIQSKTDWGTVELKLTIGRDDRE
jgi:RimJ/RimL family protein N-acetyltransferase